MKCCCVLSLLRSWKKQTKQILYLFCRYSDCDKDRELKRPTGPSQTSILTHIKHKDTQVHIMNTDRHPTFPQTEHLTDLPPNHLVIWVRDTNHTRSVQSLSNMCWMPFKQSRKANLRRLRAAKAASTASKPKLSSISSGPAQTGRRDTDTAAENKPNTHFVSPLMKSTALGRLKVLCMCGSRLPGIS